MDLSQTRAPTSRFNRSRRCSNLWFLRISCSLQGTSSNNPHRGFPEHCLVFGYTYTDRFIAVAFEILDEDVPIIRPITAFEPSAD